ncbi:hypothetical protein DPEC_G00327850 [Dallia pectoralis]|uniref:Uncharacterized protein n=1 Tax=Dallia pectoralis TaxID=75939 RepID=A0ACC2F8J6_DALPE|nr:hypothetical protein DPEC_G00327850 [Dallia pectoralis]
MEDDLLATLLKCFLCSATYGRMLENQEEDEFVAVRVQDPRVQNEGFWNSYVDFKIFLHTNSKAFTAKTSCVRRRYSEFVWLKKRLQKNTGLVLVPDLPGKSFFSFSNEDFLENRRKGLQSFLDKVCSMTVCLSDSQLHLFLQTQLPVGHILDCVQGHTPYGVTEAILTYASSNQGWVQEEDTTQEPSLSPVPYESMESPAPHLPSLHCGESEVVRTETPLADGRDTDTVELLLCETESPSHPVTRENQNVFRVEAVLEIHSPVEVSYKWNSHGGSPPGRLDCEEVVHHQGDCQSQTCLEVHCENDLKEHAEEVKTERVGNLMTEAIFSNRSGLDHDGCVDHTLAEVDCEATTALEKEVVREMAPGEDTSTEAFPEKSPELDVPEKCPESDVPEKSPELDVPEKSPELDVPEKSPELDVPEKSPELDVPEKSPELDVPEKSPELDVPEKSPELDVPEKSPELDVPEKSPELDVPEKSPELDVPEKSPELDVPEKSPELDVPEKSPELDVPEKSPEQDVPEKSPEQDVPEKSPELDVPEKSPELDVPEKSPELDVPEKSPELDVPEKSPELDAPEKSPELDAPEKSPELDVPEKSPDGHIVRGTILEDVVPAEEAQENIIYRETMSKVGSNSDTDVVLWVDSRGHGDEIKSHMEVRPEDECHEVATQQGGSIQEIQTNKDINGVEAEHPGDREATANGITQKESDPNGSANKNKVIQETNGDTETVSKKAINQSDFSESFCTNTDSQAPETHQNPKQSEVPDIRATDDLQDGDISYLVNTSSAKTLEIVTLD